MLFDTKVFLIKEQAALMKLAGTYDIYDPVTGALIGAAKEEPGGLIKFLRLFINKLMLPNKINVYDHEGQSIAFSIQKPFTLFRSKISVFNQSGDNLGFFQSKVFTIGGGFWVFDPSENKVAEVKGDWKGWNFQFIGADGQVIGSITKKWAGAMKELFTSADNYVVSLEEAQELEPNRVALLLAAGLAIDTVFKEGK